MCIRRNTQTLYEEQMYLNINRVHLFLNRREESGHHQVYDSLPVLGWISMSFKFILIVLFTLLLAANRDKFKDYVNTLSQVKLDEVCIMYGGCWHLRPSSGREHDTAITYLPVVE